MAAPRSRAKAPNSKVHDLYALPAASKKSPISAPFDSLTPPSDPATLNAITAADR